MYEMTEHIVQVVVTFGKSHNLYVPQTTQL